MKYKNIEHLKKELTWETPSNYFGEDLSEYSIIYSKNRDSDTLTNYNFEAIQRELEKISKKGVYIASHSHWACGWIEFICVKNTAEKTLKKALEILNDLDSYPVFDDMGYSEYEREILEKYISDNEAYHLKEMKEFLELQTSDLDDDLKTWIAYAIESSSSDRGVDDAYFQAENVQEAFDFIKSNGLEKYVQKVINILIEKNLIKTEEN